MVDWIYVGCYIPIDQNLQEGYLKEVQNDTIENISADGGDTQ